MSLIYRENSCGQLCAVAGPSSVVERAKPSFSCAEEQRGLSVLQFVTKRRNHQVPPLASRKVSVRHVELLCAPQSKHGFGHVFPCSDRKKDKNKNTYTLRHASDCHWLRELTRTMGKEKYETCQDPGSAKRRFLATLGITLVTNEEPWNAMAVQSHLGGAVRRNSLTRQNLGRVKRRSCATSVHAIRERHPGKISGTSVTRQFSGPESVKPCVSAKRKGVVIRLLQGTWTINQERGNRGDVEGVL